MASKRRLRRKCTAKKSYPTLEAAMIDRYYASKHQLFLRPYQCDVCSHWHLTKSVRDTFAYVARAG